MQFYDCYWPILYVSVTKTFKLLLCSESGFYAYMQKWFLFVFIAEVRFELYCSVHKANLHVCTSMCKRLSGLFVIEFYGPLCMPFIYRPTHCFILRYVTCRCDEAVFLFVLSLRASMLWCILSIVPNNSNYYENDFRCHNCFRVIIIIIIIIICLFIYYESRTKVHMKRLKNYKLQTYIIIIIIIIIIIFSSCFCYSFYLVLRVRFSSK